MKVGDVLRITKLYYTGDKSDGAFPAKYLPAWAIVTSLHGFPESNAGNIYLLGPYPSRPTGGYKPPRMQISDDYDRFEVAPPGEWPDKICAAVARLKLEGVI